MFRSLFVLGLVFSHATLVSASASPNSCESAAQQLNANYTITSTWDNGKRTEKTMSLWRMPNKVAHEYPQTHITEGWEWVHKKLLKPTRYFDEHQRAIEYQPGETIHGKTDKDWSYRNQLVSDHLLSKMTRTKSEGKACDQREYYTFEDNGVKIKVVWQPALALFTQFTVIEPHRETHWQRQSVSYDDKAITAFFDQRYRYQTTDFADIGDDHTDPFLTNMVHQGFIEEGASGFYDEHGKALGSHSH